MRSNSGRRWAGMGRSLGGETVRNGALSVHGRFNNCATFKWGETSMRNIIGHIKLKLAELKIWFRTFPKGK
jgi:hypothetical protein